MGMASGPLSRTSAPAPQAATGPGPGNRTANGPHRGMFIVIHPFWSDDHATIPGEQNTVDSLWANPRAPFSLLLSRSSLRHARPMKHRQPTSNAAVSPLSGARVYRWVDARPLSGFMVWPTDSISSRSAALNPERASASCARVLLGWTDLCSVPADLRDPYGGGLFPSCATTLTNQWLLMLCAQLLPAWRQWWSWGATHRGESPYTIRFEIHAPLSTCYPD
jgi:hypothetical protein